MPKPKDPMYDHGSSFYWAAIVSALFWIIVGGLTHCMSHVSNIDRAKMYWHASC
jgi:hypothetical protein